MQVEMTCYYCTKNIYYEMSTNIMHNTLYMYIIDIFKFFFLVLGSYKFDFYNSIQASGYYLYELNNRIHWRCLVVASRS